MADSFTNNRNLVLPLVGGDSGTWGTILNAGMMTYLDGVLGNTQAISMTASDVSLTINQWNNAAFNITGALTGDHSLILPLNANSLTVAVGGLFAVANNTTGAHAVTVKTAASGSAGVTIPQGLRSFLYSDQTNVYFCDDSRLSLQTYAGNPNGNVAGTAASANNPPSVVWDYTNNIIWVCTTTGTTSTAVWANSTSSSLTLTTPQGYGTPVSNTPIIASDAIAATVVYYTPYQGAFSAVHNGTGIIPYQFSQLQLTLSSSQAANNIYDVYLAYNAGVPVIGTGPSWLSGTGGSITPGSCARGTGASGAAISRASPSGIWVNTANMSLIYNTGSGNNTIAVSAGQGIALFSIWIDSSAGQVTCHRSNGQSRKWGISNFYNRDELCLQVSDPTASWNATVANFRPSDNNTANSFTAFFCLPEEEINASFVQTINPGTGQSTIGIGVNSTTVATGKNGSVASSFADATAQAIVFPSLGLQTITCLEKMPTGTTAMFGTNAGMVMEGWFKA